jgi:outer membrane biosynthesis protein TonB
MADNDLKRAFRTRGGAPFVVFLALSLAINGVGAYCGWWIKFPEPPPAKDDAIVLTDIDANDVENLGDPNVPQDQPPPEPEPTPPPEAEPTPPPLDKPPEFEVPQPTPAPSVAPTPESTPKPAATPKPHPQQPAVKPVGTPNPQPNAAPPGLVHGSATGVAGGTGNGGPRTGLFVRQPKPPYPPQALQMHITGDASVRITVASGNIVNVEGSGSPMLASAAARWVRENWKAAPTTNGTYTLPVSFVLAH